jgi:uncharacterized delta-60 repeat protein
MTKRLASATFVGFALLGVSLLALGLTQESTWGGAAQDEADEIAIAPDGSVYVTGTTQSFGAGDLDAFLLKYSPAGVLEWQRTYGTAIPLPFVSGADFGLGVAAAPDGSAYITGQLSDGNLFLAKFNAAGTLLWQQTWGDPGHFSRAVEVGPDGSVYVAGGTFAFGAGQADALLLKFTSDGAFVWGRTWGGALHDAAADAAIAADGAVYLVGDTSSFVWNDAFIVKFAPDGTLLWQKDWGTMHDAVTFNDSAAWGVGTASDGTVYMTGTSSTAQGNAVLVKFNAAGTVLWERVAGPDFNLGFDVAAAPDSSQVYMTGHANFDSTHADAFIVTVLANGRAREAARWGGDQSEAGTSIAVAANGSILTAGYAGAPPYAMRRVPPRFTTPTGFVITPAGTVGVPQGEVRIPLGIVTTPSGSTTFGGATDAMLLRLQP